MNGILVSSQFISNAIEIMEIGIPYGTPISIDATNVKIIVCSSAAWSHGNFTMVKGTQDITNQYVADGYIQISWKKNVISLKLHDYSEIPIIHNIGLIK